MGIFVIYSRPEFIEFFGLNSSSVNSSESDNGKANEPVAKPKSEEIEDPSTPVMKIRIRLVNELLFFFILVGKCSCESG